ncbi:MAG: hypothetical protein HYV27_00290 [Candidatus Hydrogenedentes bacterium]|nr:hypothetical protein [Candidatus Hydrogenedentota bacterium]
MIRVGWAIAILLGMGLAPLAHGADFKVGAAFRVVTPDPLLPISGGMDIPKPAKEKKGELFARAVVMEQGETRVAFVCLDFIGWPRVQGDKIRAKVTDIPKENILIGSTHTHSAPESYAFPDGKGGHTADLPYLDSVIDKAAEAINEAVANLQPAVLKINMDEAKGKIAYNYYAPELYDPRCSVLQAIGKGGKKDGKAIVTFVNYASHPEVMGSKQGIVSPDFCGPLYDRIEEKTGGMAFFMNGAQGGMVTADCRGPVDGEDIQNWDECIRIGQLLADEALRIVDAAPVQESPSLFVTAAEVPFPLDSPIMRQVLENSPLDYRQYLKGNDVMTQMNLVNVGTAQMLTIPGEALPNIGYYLKRKMPTSHPFLLGLTNDAMGYILTPEDFGSFGRYEYVSETSMGEYTGEVLIDESLKLVEASPKPDTPAAK